MQLFLEPNDFLFFRDNRPFFGGEGFSATSLGLPLPSVLYGAFRSFLLQEFGIKFEEYHKLTDTTSLNEKAKMQDWEILSNTGGPGVTLPGSLRLRGPYFARMDRKGDTLKEVFFPQPLDVIAYKQKGGNNPAYGLLKPAAPTFSSNLPAPCQQILLPEQGSQPDDKAENGYVDLSALEAYLGYNEAPGSRQVKSFTEILAPEMRIGISISEQYVTKSGMFYNLQGYRPHQSFKDGFFGLALELEDSNSSLYAGKLQDCPFFIGGERRFARLVVVDNALEDDINSRIAPAAPASLEENFKLYLATPALFNQGWLPGWINPETGCGQPPNAAGLEVKLVTAAVGRPIVSSGFDMALKQPKPIRQAVPAGSVYYFKVVRGTSEQVIEAFHNKAISDKENQAGFGVAFVGTW